MTHKKTYIILLALGCISFFGGYILLGNSTPNAAALSSMLPPPENATQSSLQEKRLVSPLKQFPWGNSPFEISAQDAPNVQIAAQASEKKLPKVKPNLIWQKRTFTRNDGKTFVYEFGKGNPAEVALTDAQIKAAYQRCGTPADPQSEGPFCAESSGYVSEAVERNLLLALSHPNWDTLLEKCSVQLKDVKVRPDSDNVPSLFTLYSDPHYRDINDWLTIDPDTGRKTLNMARAIYLSQWLHYSTHAFRGQYNEDPPSPNPTCVDVEAREIARHLSLVFEYYTRKPGVFGPIRKDLLNPKKYRFD